MIPPHCMYFAMVPEFELLVVVALAPAPEVTVVEVVCVWVMVTVVWGVLPEVRAADEVAATLTAREGTDSAADEEAFLVQGFLLVTRVVGTAAMTEVDMEPPAVT